MHSGSPSVSFLVNEISFYSSELLLLRSVSCIGRQGRQKERFSHVSSVTVRINLQIMMLLPAERSVLSRRNAGIPGETAAKIFDISRNIDNTIFYSGARESSEKTFRGTGADRLLTIRRLIRYRNVSVGDVARGAPRAPPSFYPLGKL